jgi:hypothetical protein
MPIASNSSHLDGARLAISMGAGEQLGAYPQTPCKVAASINLAAYYYSRFVAKD